jgi:hypothetical protein
MGPILNPDDLQALKSLSDDADKEATSVHASVPKKIKHAFAMCNDLDRYSRLDQEEVTVPATKATPNKNNVSK